MRRDRTMQLFFCFLLLVGFLDAKEVRLWGSIVDVTEVSDRNFSKLGDTRVYSGDTIIYGDLKLDTDREVKRGDIDYYNGVAVSGDLIVKGNIIGLNDNDAYLYVSGNLEAENILTTGYRFRVDGNITVDGLFVEFDENNLISANHIKAKIFVSKNKNVKTSYSRIDAVEIGSGKSRRSIYMLKNNLKGLSDKDSDSQAIKKIAKMVLDDEQHKEIVSDILEITGSQSTVLENKKMQSSMPDNFLDFIKEHASKIKISQMEVNATDIKRSDIAKITYLDISYADLYELPEYIKECISVKVLKIGHNGLSRLPEFLFEMSSLEKLYVNNNPIRVIPKSIKKLINLKGLYAYRTNLMVLPKELGSLPRLEDLSVSYTWVGKLPRELFGVKTLKSLLLYNTSLRDDELKDSPFSQLINLEQIDIGSNGLTKIPNDLYKVGWLKILDISDNSKKIKKDLKLEKFPNLKKLNLYGLKLGEIPRSINGMRKLKILRLGYNKLANVSSYKFPALTELYLNGNELDEMPQSVLNIQTLERLSLSDNEIDEISIENDKLRSLQYLYLSYNNLKDANLSFGGARGIKELTINSSHLRNIPSSVFGLHNLEKLGLVGNKVSDVPKDILKLGLLKKLDLYDNNITKLPNYLAEVPSMEELIVGNNPIEKYPDGFSNMNWQAKKLFIENNLSAPSRAVVLKNCEKLGAEQCYDLGEASEDDYSEDNDINILRISCKNGYMGACNAIGYHYREDKEVEAAIEAYHGTCEQKNSFGCLKLAEIYGDKDYGFEDKNKSVYYYDKACNLGEDDGCRYAAVEYRSGDMEVQNYSRAKEIYENAEGKGQMYGYVGLGSMHLKGEGFESSVSEAMKHYKRVCWYRGNMFCRNITTFLYLGAGIFFLFAVMLMVVIGRMVFKKRRNRRDGDVPD